MILTEAKQALNDLADPNAVAGKSRYFRSGKGEYGEGDTFIGVTVPQVRSVVKRYWQLLTTSDCESLLQTGCHEERLFALLVMVKQFEKGTSVARDSIYASYLSNRSYVNNWDLVDSSAFQIVGAYLIENPSDILDKLAHSESLWDRRIAIIATFAHLKNGDYRTPLMIAELLLHDTEDLIHKAVGWVIREVGNCDPDREREFLKIHYRSMPRTMLRYAIEKFPQAERKLWLTGKTE